MITRFCTTLFLFLNLCLSVSAQSLFQKDISFLTSEELGGRYPGGKEDSIAQQYISSKFSNIGLSPSEKIGSYAQKIEYTSKYWFESSLKLKTKVGTDSLKHNQDYQITSSESLDIRGLECVFVGLGMNNAYLPEVRGKAVMLYSGILPSPNTRNSKIYRNLISDLALAGAKAIVYIVPSGRIKKDRVFYGSSLKDSNLVFLSVSQNKLDLFISKEQIQRYDSLASIDVDKLPAFIKSDRKIDISIKKYEEKITTANIIGLKKGNNNKYIIIGAHYDHLGRDENNGKIYHGANDNASGVAMLLNLAERIRHIPTNCNLLFVAFAAEERGLLGSKYFVKHMPVDKENISAMINIDVIGQLKNDTLYYAKFNDEFSSLKDIMSFNSSGIVMNEKNHGLSDHIPFLQASIPTLYFNTGNNYAQLHTVEDKEELINYPGMEKTAELIFEMLKILDKKNSID